MAVNVKLGVDIGNFRSGIKDGQNILKGLNAEMKSAEAEFKATGNAEKLLSDKTKTLNSQLNVQKGIVDQAQAALKAMTDAGVDPADKAYQQLYATMMNAQAGMYQTQAALNNLSAGTEQAAEGANKLTDSVNSIGKKISLDQVISGIDTIKSGLESAAQKAIKLGEDIWNSIMDSARWADDTATMAQMYGIDLDTFQRMQKLVTNGLDTSVDALLNAQSKLNNNIGKGAKETMDTLRDLGLLFSSGKGQEQLITEDSVDLFWRAGQALMAMDNAFDKEAAAQAMFGRSWKELIPLFTEYKSLDEYNAALAEQNVVSEDTVKSLAELNDEVGKLIGDFETLKTETIGSLAPALTKGAEALDGLLSRVLEYLRTPEGQQALDDLGKAVEGLFSDLSSIDPETVVQGFSDVFDKIVGGVQWIVDNKDAVVGALKAIVIGWGALEITGGALDVVKLVDGIKGLASGGAAATAGSALGSVLTTAASIAIKAAPWLAGLAVLFENALTPQGNDNLIDKDGNLTQTAIDAGYSLDEGGNLTRDDRQIAADAAQAAWDLYRTNKLDQEAIFDLQNALGNDIAMQQLFEIMQGAKQTDNWKDIEDLDIEEWLKQFDAQLPAEIELPDDQKELLENQIGTLELPAEVKYVEVTDGTPLPHRRHANGLAYVPYDGYLAELHRGEMVVPAREVSSRNYSSNLYVESMIMNNGTDAEGLAAAMAAAQQRTMSGYGS